MPAESVLFNASNREAWEIHCVGCGPPLKNMGERNCNLGVDSALSPAKLKALGSLECGAKRIRLRSCSNHIGGFGRHSCNGVRCAPMGHEHSLEAESRAVGRKVGRSPTQH